MVFFIFQNSFTYVIYPLEFQKLSRKTLLHPLYKLYSVQIKYALCTNKEIETQITQNNLTKL